MFLKRLTKSLSVLFAVVIMSCVCCLPISANNDLDGLTGGNSANTNAGGNYGQNDGNALGDVLQDYEPISDENMANAQAITSPLVNLLGNVIGVITLITSVGIFVVTALDLTYIGVPVFRGLLTSRWQLVSDDALAIANGATMGTQQAGGMTNQMGGMPNQMGGMPNQMGGMANPMGMGGAQNQMGGQQGATAGNKTMIGEYFKRRVVFIVIFTVATILLTSSLFTGVGINLAELLTKVIDKVNIFIGNVNV